MDTIENNEAPIGAEGATSSQDTASQVDTQPVSNEQSSSDGTQEESGEASETLLAGKYKSTQELEKAHKELEKKLGELGQKAKSADILYEKYGITPDQLQNYIDQQEKEQQLQLMQNNPGLYAAQQVEALKQQLESEKALIAEQKELDNFLKKNPEYEPFKDKILKLGLTSEQDKSYEEIANEWFGQARSQGQQDAYKKIETKKTQTTGVKSAPHKNFSLDDLKNMSVSEMESILPWADVSQRL